MPRNLIDITDLSVEEIDQLIATAEDIIANPVKYQSVCAHKQLGQKNRFLFKALAYRVQRRYQLAVDYLHRICAGGQHALRRRSALSLEACGNRV